MGQVSVASLRMLAEQNMASRNYSKNLAGLKKFTESDNVDFFEKQQAIQHNLENLTPSTKDLQA